MLPLDHLNQPSAKEMNFHSLRFPRNYAFMRRILKDSGHVVYHLSLVLIRIVDVWQLGLSNQDEDQNPIPTPNFASTLFVPVNFISPTTEVMASGL